jgi:electron transfer flavoprotein beta subunit
MTAVFHGAILKFRLYTFFLIQSCNITDRVAGERLLISSPFGKFSTMEKIIVALKRALDYNVRVRLNEDGSGVAIEGAKMSINPFDEIALEEALRIKERGDAKEILVISIGTAESQQQLRTGLAMGADRAILVETDEDLEPLAVARVIKALIDKESPGLVLLGKQSIDGDNNQTGQMLAALWDRPQGTFASTIVIRDGVATVTREVDQGLEVIELTLPAVITADLRLNTPRYVKLPDIMKAKRKSLEILPLNELGIDSANQFRILATEAPEKRQKGTVVNDVGELVQALSDKGLV